VVILGAGFGGLECARRLAGAPVDVLLVDRNNYHLFTPLLYQVASSLLNPSDIAYPVRAVFRGARNVRFRLAEVTAVDEAAGIVATGDGDRLPWDYFVLATGSASHFFGNVGVEAAAHGLKDLPEAMALRNHVLSCFEAAARTADPRERRRCLTFVVVGGGPTGVEYAGALSELARLVLAREYPEIDLGEMRILLVEGRDALLPALGPAAGRHARAELERRGVELRTGVQVASASAEEVTLSDGQAIEARTLVWAAGVRPAAPAAGGLPRARSGRIETDEFLRVRGRERLFAVGDVAAVVQDGAEIPMLAPPAIQEGRWVAGQILRLEAGRPLQPFRYRDRGVMATIGRHAAVAQIGRLSLRGFPGWVAWLTLHLFLLIGFRNRVVVLLGWAWDYFRYDRPIRLIARAREKDGARA
jgi:NADH dehydrogenase